MPKYKEKRRGEPDDVEEIVGDDASEAEDDMFLQGLDAADLFWRKLGSENAEDAKFHVGDRYEPWKAVCNSIALEKCEPLGDAIPEAGRMCGRCARLRPDLARPLNA